MAHTKLTVRVDARWVEPAKRYAARHDTSLSRLISEYLRLLAEPDAAALDAPVLARLTGILPADVDTREIHEHWAEKHLGG